MQLFPVLGGFLNPGKLAGRLQREERAAGNIGTIDLTPTAEMVRQILGAVSQFEKASLVAKLRQARERIRAETGRCEGRRPVPAAVVAQARRLARKNPRTGKRRSLREIAAELAKLGHCGPSGKPYFPASVSHMLAG